MLVGNPPARAAGAIPSASSASVFASWMPSLPSIFVSHGAPTLALAPEAAGAALSRAAALLPRPRAVVVVSAHWETDAPRVSGAERPATIHDFFGFPQELYAIRYPAPGDPKLAARVRDLLNPSGLTAAIDAERGLDHGAWVSLMLMYPHADVPVVQVSLQTALGPAHHERVGRVLAPLREEGVLVVGSGSATHNLSDFRGHLRHAPPEPYAAAFDAWLHDKLVSGDREALLDYRRRAPHAVRNHPTEEHLLPLFVALGAAGAVTRAQPLHAAIEYGVLSMAAYAFVGPDDPRKGA
jgi:4,5-DOPA dioxygenase extradiol